MGLIVAKNKMYATSTPVNTQTCACFINVYRCVKTVTFRISPSGCSYIYWSFSFKQMLKLVVKRQDWAKMAMQHQNAIFYGTS